jgi:hypothetical protein
MLVSFRFALPLTPTRPCGFRCRTGPAFLGQLCRPILQDPDTNEEFFGDINAVEDQDRANRIYQQALTPMPVTLRCDQTAVSIACGSSFVVASLRDHSGRRTVHAAGANDFGQLGRAAIAITGDAKNKPAQGTYQSELRPVRLLRELDACGNAF